MNTLLPPDGIRPDPRIAEIFLRTLYDGAPRGYLTLLRREGKEDKPVKVSNFLDVTSVTMEQAAARACESATRFDVYFGAGLRAEKLKNGKRVDANSVIVIPGFWADADFKHAEHEEQNLPPDAEGALLLLRAGGMDPTLVVHTGHGLHGYYLFPRPP